MTDRDALLRAICENPDDDAPRLVYADWLDEHGDPEQAEFIRLQLELSPVPVFAQAGKDADLRIERQLQLWRGVRKWRFLRSDWTSCTIGGFVRGFHPHWRGTPADFLRVAPHYWRLGPTNSLTFLLENKQDVRASDATAIAGSEWLGTVQDISLWGDWLSDEWVAEFIKSPFANRWQTIAIDGRRLTDFVCESLVASTLVKGACKVGVNSRGLTARGRAAIDVAFPKPDSSQ
jgi:uncharacterized protein (TIGR02996 family)